MHAIKAWIKIDANPGRENYLGGGMIKEISYGIYGISRIAKIIHDPKHSVMVGGVKG
jgi:hypothetical protein